MTEKVLAALDAITARVLSYRPKDKGLAAKKTERSKATSTEDWADEAFTAAQNAFASVVGAERWQAGAQIIRNHCRPRDIHLSDEWLGEAVANILAAYGEPCGAGYVGQPAKQTLRSKISALTGPEHWTFKLGERVTKTKGSKWTGKVVGFYSTDLTPEGYAVESETEIGSVQIYPVAALKAKGLTP